MPTLSRIRVLSPLLLAMALFAGCVGCGPPGDGPDDPDAGEVPLARCEMSLDAFLEAPAARASGASVRQIASQSDLIGGPTAIAKVGDWLFENDRIRVVIQGVDRRIGPHPYGGTIIDADLVHDGPGNDQLGEIGLLYNFARTLDPELFEILHDGRDGGPAILAVTGPDIDNDYMAVRNHLEGQVGTLPAVDPYAPVPLHVTRYFILQPGEQRVQVHTAFCNVSDAPVTLLAGDLTDPGEGLEFFNGQSCTYGFGFGGTCQGLDRMSWFGLLGDGVAYATAPWVPGEPTRPGTSNMTMTLAGITVHLSGVVGIDGLLQWFNKDLAHRSGALTVQPGGSKVWASDFYVGRELGELASQIAIDRAGPRTHVLGTVEGRVGAGVQALPRARVHMRVVEADSSADPTKAEIATVFTTDDEGRFAGTFPEGTYTLSAWAEGHAPSEPQEIRIRGGQTVGADLSLVPARTLTVNVSDPSGAPAPAKVTLLCASGACETSSVELNWYTQVGKDALPAGIQTVQYVPPSGTLSFPVPAGEYLALVSRGPEYSIHPNGYPANPGTPIDLRTEDQTLNATIMKVVDTSGWLSADFHVHAINSPDSNVNNTRRVLNFLAEGVDVLVATDHDVITDFAPYVAAVGGEHLLSTVRGEEISTLDFGHYNIFPLERDPLDLQTGGALDWAGGRGPTLTPKQLMAKAREMGARTIHLNHPKSGVGGSFAMMQVDTDTLATHANPLDFRMQPVPGATPSDTGLFGTDFNAYEVLNAAEDEFSVPNYHPHFNDWFTFLSRGLKVAGTGVSDTHTIDVRGGGYYRTYVKVPSRDPRDFDPHVLSQSLNDLQATAGAGPFITVKAVRVNGGGAHTSAVAEVGQTLAASHDDIEFTVSIQAPEYLDVSRVELYMHQRQDDASCPLQSNHPNVLTTRVSCGGGLQTNWPASGVTASQEITLSPADLVTVGSHGGVTYRRWQKDVTFRLAAPTRDNWIVAMVYGERSLFPLLMLRPGSGTLDPTPGFAFSNPIFVDADGGGYDKPPFDPSAVPGASHLPDAPLVEFQSHRPRRSPPEGPVTPQRLLEGWKEIRGHH